MSRFPIECPKCGREFESRDEMKEVSKGGQQYTYHCPDCTFEVLGLTISNGEVLDSQIF